MNTSPLDPNSFANNHEAAVSHIHLNLTTDFERRVLHGYAELTVKVCHHVWCVFDNKDGERKCICGGTRYIIP